MIFSKDKQHIWQFSRVGGVNRVTLERGTDLMNLDQLDQKLWTALSCPVDGLEIDPRTLHLIDTDKDGKIRVPEILEAVRWIIAMICNADDLLARPKSLPLSAIDTSGEEGQALLASAKQILQHLGKPEATELSMAETSDMDAIFANTPFNGDGVITTLSTDKEDLQQIIGEIATVTGATKDRSGTDGVSEEQIEAFFATCDAYLQWYNTAQDREKRILPFGEQTENAYQLFVLLKSKIDDYFLRCRLAEFDPASAEMLNTLTTRIESINDKDVSECLTQIEGFPIAKIEAGAPLSFVKPVNPAWHEKLSEFKTLIGQSSGEVSDVLSEKQWREISSQFNAYVVWKSEKTGEALEQLGLERIQQIHGSTLKERLMQLVAKDKDLTDEADNIIQVDRLVRYYCDIYTLLNNFVTFSDFYSPKAKGVFQAGNLYFDQRCCELCIKVSDMPKHNMMAASSGICLVYFDCVSKVKNEKMTIVAAFTDGDVDNLSIGRNAVFYDNSGLDWDATIVKIIDNPISIRQAFWSPYRKVSKMISRQIEKIAASQNDKVEKATTAKVDKAGSQAESELSKSVAPAAAEVPVAAVPATPAATPAPVAKPAPFDIAKFAGIFAAIGLAFGAIGSVLAAVVGGFLSLPLWKVPIALAGIILVISGPSMILAWLKLRKRNLAHVLDANGWAINARATINIKFGATLTHLAKLPKNSKLNLKDPFAKKRNPFVPVFIFLFIAAIAFVLWYYGFLARWGINIGI